MHHHTFRYDHGIEFYVASAKDGIPPGYREDSALYAYFRALKI